MGLDNSAWTWPVCLFLGSLLCLRESVLLWKAKASAFYKVRKPGITTLLHGALIFSTALVTPWLFLCRAALTQWPTAVASVTEDVCTLVCLSLVCAKFFLMTVGFREERQELRHNWAAILFQDAAISNTACMSFNLTWTCFLSTISIFVLATILLDVFVCVSAGTWLTVVMCIVCMALLCYVSCGLNKVHDTHSIREEALVTLVIVSLLFASLIVALIFFAPLPFGGRSAKRKPLLLSMVSSSGLLLLGVASTVGVRYLKSIQQPDPTQLAKQRSVSFHRAMQRRGSLPKTGDEIELQVDLKEVRRVPSKSTATTPSVGPSTEKSPTPLSLSSLTRMLRRASTTSTKQSMSPLQVEIPTISSTLPVPTPGPSVSTTPVTLSINGFMTPKSSQKCTPKTAATESRTSTPMTAFLDSYIFLPTSTPVPMAGDRTTFNEVVTDAQGFECFMEHLESETASENLLYYMEASRLRYALAGAYPAVAGFGLDLESEVAPGFRKSKLEEDYPTCALRYLALFEKYISEQSVHQINIDYLKRTAAAKAYLQTAREIGICVDSEYEYDVCKFRRMETVSAGVSTDTMQGSSESIVQKPAGHHLHEGVLSGDRQLSASEIILRKVPPAFRKSDATSAVMKSSAGGSSVGRSSSVGTPTAFTMTSTAPSPRPWGRSSLTPRTDGSNTNVTSAMDETRSEALQCVSGSMIVKLSQLGMAKLMLKDVTAKEILSEETVRLIDATLRNTMADVRGIMHHAFSKFRATSIKYLKWAKFRSK